jgi:trans-aconitate 2-methyltransferase
VSGDAWSPSTYGRFAAERAQPFHDLVALVDRSRPVRRIVDLGCGTGELTASLATTFTGADVVGIDRSEAMLAQAATHRADDVRFELGDLGTWSDDGVDVVLANASLHWVPDHPAVLASWAGALSPTGQLAVQVPANAAHPSHALAASLADEEPWRSLLGGTPPPDVVTANVLAPARYAEVLHDLGFTRQRVRLEVYAHVLASSGDVVDWVRGSTLTRFAERWPADVHERFVAAYRERFLDAVGERSPYLYTFERILLWAAR